MAGLASVIKKAIQTAKKATKDLQITITLEHCNGDEKEDEKIIGRRTYDSPGVQYRVVVDNKTRYVSMDNGIQGVEISAIQFLDPVLVTTRDRITLPSGKQPQIMSIEGVLNPEGVYYAPKVIF